jgi:hypothetical protein
MKYNEYSLEIKGFLKVSIFFWLKFDFFLN